MKDLERNSVNSSEIWERVHEKLNIALGSQTVSNWFKNPDHKVDNSQFSLFLNSRFAVKWINEQYLDLIQDVCSREFGISASVELSPESSLNAATDPKNQESENTNGFNAAQSGINLDMKEYSLPLDPNMTFETFVVGKENEMAYESAYRVVSSDSRSFNPLFIYGKVGLGKTHLMHSMGWSVIKQGNKKVCYISAEQFMVKFINALKRRDMMAFKDDFRSVDMLMIDDFQFLAGKESTQEEFFHTFVYLISQSKQLVISADKPPSELSGIEERLRSRLGSGLVVNVYPATYELRLSILKEKTESKKVDPKVLEFIAEHVTSNVRELSGALNRVFAYFEMFNRPITIEVAKSVLNDFTAKKKITKEDILKKVCVHYSIHESDIMSSSRKKVIVKARQFAMFLCRDMTDSSLPEIGRLFGGKDHTTALYSIRQVEKLSKQDASVMCEIEDIRNSLK
ncbi:chromosomal replication initiator protein DnaA [Candidatus Nesciobacter abundans]|uniref:chromosomal replication initiator protein DnaA n=1 Tax=Candidatus Nesciobacter abundans TaxID=2601668 RepID=UPI001653B853|nr:chromosomal replication initiator protein DnaA [Candidatus Nesciobacter abundans]